MKRSLMLLALLASLPALAAERWIVPVYSFRVHGATSWSYSRVLVANSTAATATVHVETLPAPADPACRIDDFTVPAHDRIYLHPLGECTGFVSAVVLTSDTPLDITARVNVVPDPPLLGCYGAWQDLPVARDFLPANTNAWIPAFDVTEGYARANLFLINPGNDAITVTYHLENLGYKGAEVTAVLPPKSLRIDALHEVPVPILCIRFPCAPEHQLFLRSTGEFYAGVSSVYVGNADATFNPAVPLRD